MNYQIEVAVSDNISLEEVRSFAKYVFSEKFRKLNEETGNRDYITFEVKEVNAKV